MKVVLHLGQHKTGSKALQSFLSANRDHLKAKGILYPLISPESSIAAFRNSHFKLYELLRAEFLASPDSDQGMDNLSFLFQTIEDERSRINANIIILSAEDLFDMQTAHDLIYSEDLLIYAIMRLRNEIIKLGWQPILVIYLRRPDHLIYAQYAQYIKGNSRSKLLFDEFFVEFEPRLNSLKLLELWASEFDKANIIVRPYEKLSMPDGIVLDFFREILHFPPCDNWENPVKNIESSNITPDFPYIHALRLLNKYRFLSLFFPRKIIMEMSFLDISPNSKIEYKIGKNIYNNFIEKYRPDYLLIAKQYANLPAGFFLESWHRKEGSKNRFINQIKIYSILKIFIKAFIRKITKIFY